nr:MAG TPA: hypothetical protein [Caudoviricetes sp.]
MRCQLSIRKDDKMKRKLNSSSTFYHYHNTTL